MLNFIKRYRDRKKFEAPASLQFYISNCVASCKLAASGELTQDEFHMSFNEDYMTETDKDVLYN